MLIGQVASRSGVLTKTVRYYESLGLVPPADRLANGYRDYPDTTLDRLAFIRAAQSSGFTLGEIREIVAFRDQGHAPCSHVRDLIDRHATDVEQRITELQRMRDDLGRLARRARRIDPTDCHPSEICHILVPRSSSVARAPSAQSRQARAPAIARSNAGAASP
ncbi:MAG: heavy metal-responsive transcriptional regulator [Actinomycetota bacterium]|nr:heavy metal-responsive transcriptional regulator [Actinomycetota bacterium]